MASNSRADRGVIGAVVRDRAGAVRTTFAPMWILDGSVKKFAAA